jgi:hypothetical protein
MGVDSRVSPTAGNVGRTPSARYGDQAPALQRRSIVSKPGGPSRDQSGVWLRCSTPSVFRSSGLARERNDSKTTRPNGRPAAHLRAKVNSSRRRSTRCRSKASPRRIWVHAQGCSKCRRRHSSRPSSMAASFERRSAISALTFLRSIRMRVAPMAIVRSFCGRKQPSAVKKSNWPWRLLQGQC